MPVRRLCVVAAAALSVGAAAEGGRRAAEQAIKVEGGYIAVPGGLTCPRDCDELDDQSKCEQGGLELGLPCGTVQTVNQFWKTPAVAANPDAQARYNALLAGLGMQLSGAMVSGVTTAGVEFVGTEITQMWWLDSNSQQVLLDITNKTDESTASIMAAWDAAPVNKEVNAVFKGVCQATVLPEDDARKYALGGCSWRRGSGLVWNGYTDTNGLRDVQPWQQVVNGKRAVPGKGQHEFRICKCTKMPQFVAVMHAKCAPRCRRDYDPCSQHAGCRRIGTAGNGPEAWAKCRRAADHMEWHARTGSGASQVGSIPETWAAWNSNFDQETWRANRGTPSTNLAPTPAICPDGGPAPCLRSTLWREDAGVTMWSGSGLEGQQDKYCDIVNTSSADFDNNRWYDRLAQQWKVLAPPAISFSANVPHRIVPTAPWSMFWPAPASFDNAWMWSEMSRPEGCTINGRNEPSVFYPWNVLRLKSTPQELERSQCCPPNTFGVSCFVENCTMLPCVSTAPGEDCAGQAYGVDDVFELCECDVNASSNDECEFFGQPCGVGQVCEDSDHSNTPDANNRQYECKCTVGGTTTTAQGEPAICPSPLNIKYVAKPAGRGCGECSRVVSEEQCVAAAQHIGLLDQTVSVDSEAHRRLRPCGCHYCEHGAACADNGGECLRFNPVYGDGVYDGCDAYEAADAHDFLICACKETVPKYVAEVAGTCRAADSCVMINNKQDCKAAAEYIGMHLAVHEEQEALLLLGDAGVRSKALYNNYLGADNNTYQHNDNGLGPVVGDGIVPGRRESRPPGCHYLRRYDADILPDGSTANWPHLLFNPLLTSTVQATTPDMMLCDCTGGAVAPTPAPTLDNDGFAAQQGFTQVGQGGRCVYAGLQEIPAADREIETTTATFQTCLMTCKVSARCRGFDWFLNPTDHVDREGLGVCHQINHCAGGACPEIVSSPLNGYSCFAEIPSTPAPTPAPTFPDSHVGGQCRSYCCSQTTREGCCGSNSGDCNFGPGGGYCAFTGTNRCERNCYPREGPCLEIELCFRLGNLTLEALQELMPQIAKEATLLIGSNASSIVPVEARINEADGTATAILRCPDGGCGSKQYVVDELCFNGEDAELYGDDKKKVGINGTCLKAPADGVFTEAMPKAEIAGLQPYSVTATGCACQPSLDNVTMAWSVDQWVATSVNYTLVQVPENASSLTPAWSDQPPVNSLCNMPAAFQGLYQFQMDHCVPLGTQFNIRCPQQCGVCDVYIVHYHEPPCSSDVNGRWPALLTADGWVPSSCAPCMTDDQSRWPMVAYRRSIQGGKSVSTPPVETACLKYFSIFAGPGVYCEDNVLQDPVACRKAGGLCVWRDGACVTEWCPRKPGRPPAVQQPGTPKDPTTPERQCFPPPGAQCPEQLSRQEMDARLEKLVNNTEVHGSYKLLNSSAECASADMYLGTVATLAECAAACKRDGQCDVFIFGAGAKQGLCYRELTADDCATEGTVANSYSLLKLLPLGHADADGSF